MNRNRVLSLVVFIAFGLSGCGTTGVIAVGALGGIAAGYYVGKDDRTIGQIADDISVTASIKTKFVGDKQVSALNINVDTYKGVVTLYGSMNKKTTEGHAMRLASEVGGVTKVISKITVVGPAN
ncbi:MAG: hypothetical protein COB04_01965 [Gammaproteobacteria bacterium]|nr:MAG: hypothetical protein COB04_01965 [Gammaproteobacteria bacterium]